MRTARLPMFSTESVDLGWWTVKAGMNKNKQWKTQGRKRFGICTEQEFPAFTNEVSPINVIHSTIALEAIELSTKEVVMDHNGNFNAQQDPLLECPKNFVLILKYLHPLSLAIDLTGLSLDKATTEDMDIGYLKLSKVLSLDLGD
ncbi:hypothetical protein HGM15179_011010 [Zosterops borbonicus]|uniref:Uncharacterized protein n=1 Tax=Zosterops borbonicus TaxID=364589 RepID=A0A8K1GD85_9PASS|nr:hypothetical protein HGM15179_011010 [Zosterops borbonicus]